MTLQLQCPEQENSLSRKVYQTILRGGIVSMTQILGELGYLIPASRALARCRSRDATFARCGRNKLTPRTEEQSILIGKRQILKDRVDSLRKWGHISIVRKGVYKVIEKEVECA